MSLASHFVLQLEQDCLLHSPKLVYRHASKLPLAPPSCSVYVLDMHPVYIQNPKKPLSTDKFLFFFPGPDF